MALKNLFYDQLKRVAWPSCFLFVLSLPVFSEPVYQVPSGLEAIAKSLGWKDDPATCCGCGGYFENEDILKEYLAKQALPQPGKKPILILGADQGLAFSRAGTSDWKGNVSVLSPDQKLTAHEAKVSYSNQTQKIESMAFSGGVHLIEPDRLVIADHGVISATDKTGELHEVIYRVPDSALVPQSGLSQAPKTVWGQAKQFNRLSPGHDRLLDATYTLCPWRSHFWTLKASQIDIDHTKKEVAAKNAVLYIKNVPVFYWPYYSFSLDKKRKSGFLSPSFGFSSSSGFSGRFPFYWNIAPNYDATVTPTFFTLRGAALSPKFRYLTSSSQGTLSGSYFFHDNAFDNFKNTAPNEYVSANPNELSALKNASAKRGSWSWKDNTVLGHKWTAATDVNWVSDDYYVEQLPFLKQFNPYNLPNQVLQQGQANYFDKHWSFTALVQHYQTLHPIDLSPTNNQYARLPELDWDGHYDHVLGDLDFDMSNQYVNFIRGKNPWETTSPLEGSRFDIAPEVSLPLNWAGGYFTPSMELEMTQYELQNTGSTSTRLSRVLPLTSVDSGLHFSREIHFLGQSYTQSLSPRLFYLYVPYRDQSAFPLFDTFSQVLTYDQMFLSNRFTGVDRIGDANQMTFGLSTRFVDEQTGLQKFSAGIATIAYFQHRRVLFCNSVTCSPEDLSMEETLNRQMISPVANVLSYNFNPAWNVTENTSYVTQTGSFGSGNVNIQYKPAHNKVMNLGYQFERGADPSPLSGGTNDSMNNLSRVTASFSWPVTDSWQLLGAAQYNVSHNNGQQYLAGIGYNTCCWALQLAGTRQFAQFGPNNNPQYNNGVVLEFTLKGLGAIGDNALGQIGPFIPGYEDTASERGLDIL